VAATSPDILVDQPGGRRGATTKDYIAALTGLRGFAAMVVLVGHAAGHSAYPWIGFPSYGPIALFVLSGFLLFQPWSKWLLGRSARPSVREFARRRAWRILPPYLVLLAVVWLILPTSRPSELGAFVRSLTLTNIYVPGEIYFGLGHVWSLGTEASWYVVLPAVAMCVGLLVHRAGVAPSVAVIGVVVAMLLLTLTWRSYIFRTESVTASMTFPMLFPNFAVAFFGGAAVGFFRVQDANGVRPAMALRFLSRHGVLTLVLALGVGVIGASQFGGPWGFEQTTLGKYNFRGAAMTLMALLLVAGVASSPRHTVFGALFGSRPVVAIGRWSYGIYLWHYPVLVLITQHFGPPQGAWGLLTVIAVVSVVAFGLGAATYRFVEQPAIAFSKRRRREPT